MKEYYCQRSSVPGTLLISEGTIVSPSGAGGFPGCPGIWTTEQVNAWRAITEAVHERGCYIFCQLFGLGRAADAEISKGEGVDVVGPSAIAIGEGYPVPGAMSVEEVGKMKREFVVAAENAMRAGFDGVEVHGANGYLLDQFLQDTSNVRGDEYGGSVENRSRLLFEILKATGEAVGPERVGLRLSPWSRFQGMGMEDPIPQFEDVIGKAGRLGLAYLHLVEPRVSGAEDQASSETLDFAYKLWNGPLLVAGGHDVSSAKRLVEEYAEKDIVVTFGRHFIANPDLVYRAKKDLPLGKYERNSFYVRNSAEGYVDYPFSAEYLADEKA